MPRQPINKRKLRLCSQIIGKTVYSAFANGDDLPHHVYLAYTGPKSVYLVNIKHRRAKAYVVDGKFVMNRLKMPMKFFISYEEQSGIPEITCTATNEDIESEYYIEDESEALFDECVREANKRQADKMYTDYCVKQAEVGKDIQL